VAQLAPQRIGDRLQRELRGGVGAGEGKGDPAADRAHVHDSSPRRAQRGEKGLSHGHLPDEVDLHLVAQLVDRHELQRRGHGDAGVVHQSGDWRVTERAGRRRDRVGVGHIERERLQAETG